MLGLTNDWLWIFLVFAVCQGTRAREPEMSPDNPEIHLNEGDSLEITCTSTEPIHFYYPKMDDPEPFISSTPNVEEKNFGSTWRVVFTRPNTLHGDTGWYGCAGEKVVVTPGRYDEPDVKWTYVYVKSNTSYFVQEDVYESFREVLGGVAKIPCRPTSPDYNVKLTGHDDMEIEMGSKASYDPKFGFTLINLTTKQSGYYRCTIEVNGVSQDVNFHIYVMRIPVLNEPKIIKSTLRHVTIGQTLRVNCTTDVDADVLYVFNWTTPHWSNRISINEPITKPIAINKDRVTYELTIKNVTDQDEGNYECAIKTFADRKNVSTYITIHDPNIKYINLTPEDFDRYYQKKYGDHVQWVVHIDAYPQPTLKWLSPKGDEIVGSWIESNRSKHAIQTSTSSTTLRINRLDLYDMGLYILQATNEEEIKTLNFTLEIIAKPVLILEELEAFYLPRQKVNLPCHVAAFPAPNISWNFLKTPNYPSMEGSQNVSLENSSMSQTASAAFLSVVSMTIDDFGDLTATACNTLGCDSVTGRIFVSDVPSGFGVIEPSEALTEGDDVKIACAASIHNYTGAEWLDKDENPLRESERVTMTTGRTRFTHRMDLHIKSVQKADNGSLYVCRALTMDSDNFPQRADYKLIIYDPEPPELDSNMNRTELTLDLSTEGHKTLILTCYTRGTPMPNVTWYKDDTRITDDDQYMLLHKNQELHIKYLLDANNGKYKCEAKNRFGKKENYQLLTIKGKEVSKVLIGSIVVLVVVCIILVIYFSIKMHREKVMRKQLMEAGLTHFEEGALECLNPELTVDDQAELLPYDKKWEFPRERLKFGKQLGFGAFGVVMKADAQGICDDEAVTTVAVKMVRRTTESTYIRALASELKIMVHLGKHLNVVNLLGACTKNITKRELLVIVEYCRFGNLHNYLFRHRADFINQIDPASGKLDPTIGLDILTRTTSVGSNNSLSANSNNSNPGAELVSYTVSGTDPQSISMSPDGCVLSNNSTQPGWRSNYTGDYKDQNLKPICTQDLLSWAFQVARGMEYLSQRKVLHGDLAARNILLAENNIVKICDFGLAKTMYKDDNYKKKGDAPLPIKWMAIESIRDRIFSTQSDIWSFGIVLWEFFTLAKTPYPGMEAEKQYQRLIEGYRMEQPEYATDEVYDIMLQCWKAKPTLRPTFTSLVASIGDLLEESVKEHYVDLNAPYLNMNTIVLESGKNDYLTMMSAPDHDALSSPIQDYVNSPTLSPSPGAHPDPSYLSMTSPSSRESESGIFSPRNLSDDTKFPFPMSDNKMSMSSDSESEAVEASPMLAQPDDNYLKPINVHERRAEFARRRQAQKNAAKTAEVTDPSYCNAPHGLGLNDAHRGDGSAAGTKKTGESDPAKDYEPSIIRTQDNYVNMPRQKNNLRKEGPASFSNPSYIIMDNREIEQPTM